MIDRTNLRASMLRAAAVLLGSVFLVAPQLALGSETIKYGYDELGRLISVNRTGTVNNGASECYAYDKADNRQTVTTSTGSDCTNAPPSFSVSSNGPVTEGGASSFTITRNGNASAAVSVSYSTSDGTAAAPGDYTAVPVTSITFQPGDGPKTVTVSTIDDTAVESAETFSLNLSNPSAGTSIATGTATGTINDNDTCTGVSFSIASNGAVTEGAFSGFTITKTGTTTASCSVTVTSSDGTATAPADYSAINGAFTFTPTQTTQGFSLSTVDDAVIESPETFSVALSNPTGGSTLGTPSAATATINDNDTPACSGVSFTIASNGAVTEGGTSVFTVTKSGTTSSSCTVNYATANGTAASPGDFTAASGTLTFTSGQTSQTLNVTTIDDATQESAETYSAALSAPSAGATLGSPSSATATINDNDPCGGVSFTIASNGAVTEGANSGFTVTKTGSTSSTCSVNYATSNGTAVAPGDYTSATGSLNFTSAQTSQVVNVATIDDTAIESAETFSMALSSPTGSAALGSPSSATATINDNDTNSTCSGISFSVNDVSALEGNSLLFVVTKTGSTSVSCSVNYATANGTAGALDFTATSGTLTFTSGTTQMGVSVVTKTDTRVEGDETMFLNLSSPTSPATISDSQGVGTINDANGCQVNCNAPVFGGGTVP